MKTTLLTNRGLAVLLLLGTCVLTSAGPVSAAGPKGAEWEIKTTIEMPGMPVAIPPTITRQCIEDKAVPYQSKGDEKCETIYNHVSGNTLSWQVVCSNGGRRMEMTGETTYTGNTMDSKVKVKSPQGDMSMRMTGKKLGACK